MLYRDFQPTCFDPKGLNLPDQQDWRVLGVSRTRDSDCLAESNFAAAVELLGGESGEVQVHLFNHWGPGWFEIILIDPAALQKMAIADDIESAMENYPVLDEEDYSRREYEQAAASWEYDSVRGRVEACQRSEVSIFAARRDTLPDDLGNLIEYYTRN